MADEHDAPKATGPIGGQMNTVVFGLARRMRVSSLVKRHSSTNVMGFFAFANGVLSIGIMSAVALVTGSPFIFPSLGPTAFLFFYTPTAPSASPKNTVFG
ncbi:MAG: HPP family protein, partial [Acidimicrobiia bacterium]|nr:HPP family protein [Acidimicrobiia bacterium]